MIKSGKLNKKAKSSFINWCVSSLLKCLSQLAQTTPKCNQSWDSFFHFFVFSNSFCRSSPPMKIKYICLTYYLNYTYCMHLFIHRHLKILYSLYQTVYDLLSMLGKHINKSKNYFVKLMQIQSSQNLSQLAQT